MTPPLNDHVQFRLLHMPCCHILICWVNPRRPMYCPECGASVIRHFMGARWHSQYSPAWLRIEDYDAAIWAEEKSAQ